MSAKTHALIRVGLASYLMGVWWPAGWAEGLAILVLTIYAIRDFVIERPRKRVHSVDAPDQ